MKLRRIRMLTTVMTVVVALVTVAGDLASAASGRQAVKVPSGTTLEVADQFEILETPLTMSGQAQGIPFTVQYSNLVGAPAVFQALQAGDADFTLSGDSGLAQPQEEGIQFKVVAVCHTTGGGFGLAVAPGEDITAATAAQLRGKKIGYTEGTADQSYVLSLLNKIGLKPSDVDLVNIPSNALASAVQSGSVDVATTAEPVEAGYLAQYPGAKVIQTPNVYSGLTFLVASAAALKSPAKTAAIANYLERLVKGYAYTSAHLSTYVDQYYGTYLKISSSLLPSILSTIKPTQILPVTPALIKEEQANTNLLTAAGALPAKLDVSKIFTTKFNKYVEAAQQ